MSAMLGQPDWFGLIFAFMLLLLTLDHRFDRIDLPRYLLIFAATAGVILTRRWYLYFVVGYCFAYVLLLVVSSVRLAKSGQQSRAVHRLVRLAVFGLCAAGAMVLLLLPMVRKILGFDYAGRYSYYNFGGITLELAAQTLRIGLLNFILIGLYNIMGMKNMDNNNNNEKEINIQDLLNSYIDVTKRNINTYGKKAQIEKLKEELDELKEALEDYENNSSNINNFVYPRHRIRYVNHIN